MRISRALLPGLLRGEGVGGGLRVMEQDRRVGCSVWWRDRTGELVMGLTTVVLRDCEERRGLVARGGVGGWRADMRRVCLISACWELRRLWMLLFAVRKGCELKRWTGANDGGLRS